jgi:putative transposase
MSTPPRRSEPEQIASNARTFFVTSSTWDKRNMLQSDRAAGLFLNVLYEYRAQGKFRLHEFVVMPDHFHLLLTVGSEISVERAVQFIKGGFAFRAGKELGVKATFWQKGFSEVRIPDSPKYAKVREYIRNNPVKRRLVLTAEQYLFSSAHLRFELDLPPQGLKPVEFLCLNDIAKAAS